MITGSEARVAALSGPNIAPEIARGLPAATVVASGDPATAAVVRDCCTGSQLRVYSNDDLTGVEYGGALKNVVAIAAGIGDGAGAGDNGKAAVITRGLAEMARLGVRAGARPLTFAGLTGLGDCVGAQALVGRGHDLAKRRALAFAHREASTSRAASMVRSTCSAEWASEGNHASNCDGGG